MIKPAKVPSGYTLHAATIESWDLAEMLSNLAKWVNENRWPKRIVYDMTISANESTDTWIATIYYVEKDDEKT